MEKLRLLQRALAYIEGNLTNSFHTTDVAKYCYCSKSTLEKLFKCLNGISVHDYVIRRRMVLAAKILQENPAQNLLELAVQCSYNSSEAFGRAFKSVWNCLPSEFSRTYKFSGLYPQLELPIQKGDRYMKKHDISELYDLFLERENCYFVCADIKGLTPLNEISRKAGDLAILETMKRLSNSAGEEDIVFRIGGDEFVILTNTRDTAQAELLAEKVRAQNGKTFSYEEQEFPLFLHVGVAKVEAAPLRYDELFATFQDWADRIKHQSPER